MAVYLVTGRLGAGKSLAAVGRIRDYLMDGRPVATNLDLRLEGLLPARARRCRVMRVPDKPTVDDLDAIGFGNDTPDESRNGLLVLDELGSWLNARDWGDKTRRGVIDWLIHSRKKGWDVLFIAQHPSLIDKQVREALVEFHAVCRRLDRLKIPFIGGLLKLASGGLLSGKLPKIHIAIVRYGATATALVAERWVYRAHGIYQAYDTRQVFSPDYPHGLYSYLTPWHLVGRFRPSILERLRLWWRSFDRRPARRAPAARLRPLLQLPPDARIRAARALIASGAL